MRKFVGLFFLFLISSKAYSVDQTLPECVHWTNAFVFTEFMQQARVLGSAGQRLTIYRENPQLCALEGLGRCETAGYLIPNDRVTIGHECGSWAHVEFKGKKTRTTGWVEIVRLNKLPPDAATLEARKKGQQLQPSNDPLQNAVRNGDINSINELLKTGANINVALDLAVVNNRTDVVVALLKLGANPNVMPAPCHLMINAVTANSNLEILEILLKTGASLNCTAGNQMMSPLKRLAAKSRAARPISAAIHGDINPEVDPESVINLFVKYGVNVNARDVWGGSPLRATVENNNVDIAGYLIEHGADVNNYLDSSVIEGNRETAIEIGNEHGNTILMEAIFWYSLRSDPSMIELLLKHGADVNYKNQEEYHDPEVEGQGHYRFASGQTALTIASSNGYLNVVKLLLEHGADPNIPREDGKTALELSVENKHPGVSKLLRDSSRIKN